MRGLFDFRFFVILWTIQITSTFDNIQQSLFPRIIQEPPTILDNNIESSVVAGGKFSSICHSRQPIEWRFVGVNVTHTHILHEHICERYILLKL